MFKDEKLLYRFRKDDLTFPFNIKVKVFIRGQRLYEHVITGRDSILQLREEQGVAYQHSFPGCQLIDWLLQNGETESKCQVDGRCGGLGFVVRGMAPVYIQAVNLGSPAAEVKVNGQSIVHLDCVGGHGATGVTTSTLQIKPASEIS